MEAHTSDVDVQQAPRRRLLDFGGRSEGWVKEALVLPSRLYLLFIIAFPAAVAIYIGFTSWSPLSGDTVWGAHNHWHWFDGYWEALTSMRFWKAIWRTVLITVVAVGVEFTIGLFLALLFVNKFRGRGILTLFFLLPMMVVPAVTGFMFFMIFQIDGPLNEGLSAIAPGEIKVPWLTNPDIAIWSVMTVDIWQWTPLMFLIFLAGLAAIPEDQLNQARVLGAGWWYQFRYLMLPMMKPIILIAIIIRGMETLKLFDSAFLLTTGGPGDATENISIFLFREVIINARWGFASAVAILVLIAVSIIAFRAIRPIERAQDETMEELVGEAGRGAKDEVEETAPVPAEARA